MAVRRELVTLNSLDGEIHDGLFHHDPRATRRRERQTGRRTAQLHVHGIMGNFLVGTLRFLPAPYAAFGVPMLVAETRMGNVGQLFGDAILDDALVDLDAAVAWLRDEGYDHLILSGYSSGATLAVRYAATRDLSHLRGVVLYGAPWGLPQSAERRSVVWGADPPYDEVAHTVHREIAADPDARSHDRLFVIARSRGPTRKPCDSEVYTWRTWWRTRGPNAVGAMTFRQIAAIRVPLLLIQGDADHVVDPSEATRLAGVARAAGNQTVDLRFIPGAGHSFAGHDVTTTRVVMQWLDRCA